MYIYNLHNVLCHLCLALSYSRMAFFGAFNFNLKHVMLHLITFAKCINCEIVWG